MPVYAGNHAIGSGLDEAPVQELELVDPTHVGRPSVGESRILGEEGFQSAVPKRTTKCRQDIL